VRRERVAVGAAAAAALAFSLLVAASPPSFFALAAPLCVGWIAISLAAAPPGVRRGLRPTPQDVLLGVGAGLLLYGLSRAFLWLGCGGLSDVLCAPLAEMFVRFRTRALFPAIALLLLVAPAEELFWRGVVQARLGERLGAAAGVALATLLAVALALATDEPFLALATAPTYAVWGVLAAWRASLVPAIVSHALWSALIASAAPPA
jgi:membrane protease YdiL (CAAX protease family)